MKKLVPVFLLALGSMQASAQQYSGIWKPVAGQVPTKGARILHPERSLVYTISEQTIEGQLSALPEAPEAAQLIDLPTPEGTYRAFRIWQTPAMEPGLARRYAGIRTFTAEAADNHHVTAKIDYTPFGFHAMIFDGTNTYFIDPYSNVADGYYLCYYKKDYTRPVSQHMVCEVKDREEEELGKGAISLTPNGLPRMQSRVYGTLRKKYRLALACTAEYAIAVAGANPTKAAVLAKMVTSVNRVNGVYERELAVTMQLVANTDTLIFLTVAGEPYTNNNGGTMLGQNQTTVNARIGTANYDFGHVFSTGGGGIASLGCICKANSKAQGVTGLTNPIGDAFDIDYVAHEMGHQFGSNHTFNNNNSGSCSGNAVASSAYEVGSGSTIMAYAGICGGGNDYQQHSDAYFHSSSLEQITTYINNTVSGGGLCPVTAISTNTNATMPPFSATYYIPYMTPFELTAPAATDATSDTALTYCWEDRDLGDFGKSLALTHLAGPLFRSFSPDTSRTRVFPTLSQLVNNITSYAGEKLPDTGRNLRFKVTERDIYQGFGCFNFPDDTVHLTVVNTGAPFRVTGPDTAAVTWIGNTKQPVTWDISMTDQAPISCAAVDIYLSIDGGFTYPYLLKANVPNTGVDTVLVPFVVTSKARVKVKGSNNVFFDLSNNNFTIQTPPAAVSSLQQVEGITVSPVPAHESLSVTIDRSYGNMIGRIVNAVGQTVWTGTLAGQQQINVAAWAKGVYYLQLSNDRQVAVNKALVIQ